MIRDIQFLHKHTCLDMNDFNFMIGFGDPGEIGLHPMTEEEQVEYYENGCGRLLQGPIWIRA